MKSIVMVSILSLAIAGCASKDQLYYDAAKAISKDNTVSQTACWVAISDIAKGGNEGAKVGAIALAEKCKNETMKIERPRNWMGF
jgi:outer membrane lipoprotein SlyB